MPTATLPTADTDFRTLALQVRAAGLLKRRPGYYSAKIVLTLGALAGVWALFLVIGDSWTALGLAVALGVISTQLGFIGHDAGHRQVFTSARANRLLGLGIGNALIGLSFGWWVDKHSAHHAFPNQIDRDPDIGVGLVPPPSPDDQGPGRKKLAAWLVRRQAELFFPFMLLRSTGLYVSGVRDVLRRRDRTSVIEGLLLVVHTAAYLTAVFWVLSPLRAIAFIVVQEAVFSVYLGCSFAPNHKGMPLVDGDSKLAFARRQVTTARNITGSRWVNFIFGGLNFQIEHHLFPTMPRPNLARAQHLVRAFCAENDLEYREESAYGSYVYIVRQLRLAARCGIASNRIPVEVTRSERIA